MTPGADRPFAARQQSLTPTGWRLADDDPRWYERAVFYELSVRAFCDSNADGTGDLAGVVDKLDYLAWLGVDCLWLLPFFPSPLRDGGYDVAEYCDVAPEFGTLEDMTRLIGAAHDRGMRVIIDLVLNHTSDAHPWFVESRSSRTTRRPTGTSGATTTRAIRTSASSSRTPRPPTGPGTPGAGSTTGTASSTSSRTSTTTTPRCARRSSRWSVSGSTSASTASGSTPRPTSSSARARTGRTCPRRTPFSARSGR